MIIATHDGSFHADETLACAILTYLFENSNIIRSRDMKILEKADLIIDVSGKNDERHYDHHSNAFTLERSNGIRYATAGIIWEKYGIEYLHKIYCNFVKANIPLISDAIFEKAFLRIDREVMWMVDLNDNGQLNEFIDNSLGTLNEKEQSIVDNLNELYRLEPSIPYLVAMQNLPNISGQEQNKAFLNTVKILKTLMQNIAINALHTEYGIDQVLHVYDGGPILIMHERLPWTNAFLANPEIFKDCYLAVYPDRKRGWRIQSLPHSAAQRFKNRCSAPKAWRGLDFENLDKATSLSNTIFVHKAGFTGGAMDFETNLEMARLWLKHGEYLK